MNQLLTASLCLVLVALSTPEARAETGQRTAPIVLVQMESTTRVGYEGIVWIRQDAPWAGSASCNATWGYFNANQNPHFMVTALASRLKSQPVRVLVDDALPKLDGICQIFNM